MGSMNRGGGRPGDEVARARATRGNQAMRDAGSWWGAAVLAAGLMLTLAPGRAEAQAVAFQPNVATIPDGVAMSAVPAVSADRRYVRLSVNPSFQTVDAITNIGIPFGVAGMGSGTGTAAGAAALAGAGFPGAGGFRSVGTPMGMNGPVAAGAGTIARSPATSVGTFPSADDGYGVATADESWSPVSPRTRAARSKVARAKKAAIAAKGR